MGINAAHICDLQSEQQVTGKKSFSKGLKIGKSTEPGAHLKVEQKNNLRIDCAEVRGNFAGKFSGDASELKNIPLKNLQANHIQACGSFQTSDNLVIQKVLDNKVDSELKKIKINDLLSLIPSQNGALFDFINNGENVGGSLEVLKGRKISGRTEVLEFRTIRTGVHIDAEQTANEIVIDLAQTISVASADIRQVLVVPRVEMEDIKTPIIGMIVYDTKSDSFYGYGKNKWVSLMRYTSHF